MKNARITIPCIYIDIVSPQFLFKILGNIAMVA